MTENQNSNNNENMQANTDNKQEENNQAKGFWETLNSIRRVFLPIEAGEFGKFLPMALMMMCILFDYSLMRAIKDGLVVTQIGTEALSFLKLYGVLPAAALSFVIYSKLCNVMNNKGVFYTIISFFTGFLFVYALILYPNQELLHPDPVTIDNAANSAPMFQWFIKIWGKWTYGIFYIMAELWGSVVLSLLFWQFANQITTSPEAKRFYPMFGLIGNIGLVLTAVVTSNFHTPEQQREMMSSVMSAAGVGGLCCIALYWYLNNIVLASGQYSTPDPEEGSKKKKKPKLTMKESFKMIFSSKYIGFLAVIVMAYGVSVNLIEAIWKSQIKLLHSSEGDFTAYMGQFMGYQGIVAILFMFIGSNILRKTSWYTSAMFTPVMMLITGTIFFAIIFLRDELKDYWDNVLHVSPLVVAVVMGAAQNILSKATKYSLFDATKEMAYIPLDQELKTKGKAAVDVIGGRLGKSGGAAIQSVLFMIFTGCNIIDLLPTFAIITLGIIIAWTVAVKALSKEYYKLVDEEGNN
jgi:AAA family ATP:ADP antiporter